jgi:hypothetical protein
MPRLRRWIPAHRQARTRSAHACAASAIPAAEEHDAELAHAAMPVPHAAVAGMRAARGITAPFVGAREQWHRRCPSERRDSAISSCVGSASVCRAELLHLNAALESLLCHLRPAAASCLPAALLRSAHPAQGAATAARQRCAAQHTDTARAKQPLSLARRHFLPSHAAPPAALPDVPAAWRWLLLRCLDGRRRGRRCVGPSGGRTAMQVRRTRERRAAFLMGSHTAREPLLAPCAGAEHRARLRMRSRDAALQTHTARLAPLRDCDTQPAAPSSSSRSGRLALQRARRAPLPGVPAPHRDAPACAPLDASARVVAPTLADQPAVERDLRPAPLRTCARSCSKDKAPRAAVPCRGSSPPTLHEADAVAGGDTAVHAPLRPLSKVWCRTCRASAQARWTQTLCMLRDAGRDRFLSRAL